VIELIRKKLASSGSYIVEFSGNSFSSDSTSECYLFDVTIDPAKVQITWEHLAEDLFAEQVTDYPKLMHSALADSLNKKARNATR